MATKAKEREAEIIISDDDVISWLNAPLGRAKNKKLFARNSTLVIWIMSSSNDDDYYDGISTACKSH
jgi:hypothetical protein